MQSRFSTSAGRATLYTAGAALLFSLWNLAGGQSQARAEAALSFATPFRAAGLAPRMKITFAGYDQAERLTNFPVLVALGPGISGFSYAGFSSPNGWDLRFADAAQEHELNYEIEKWDTNGTSLVWVQVPVIGGSGDYILAYWGEAASDPPAYSTNGATWSSGYMSVWHLRENPASGAPQFHDSATVAFTATANGGMTVEDQVPARIDGGLDFDAGNDYLNGPKDNALRDMSALTVSAWVKRSGVGGAAVTYDGNSYGAWQLTADGNASLSVCSSAHNGWQKSGNSTTVLNPGTWYHVAGVWNGSTARIFVNGIAENIGAASFAALHGTDVEDRLRIGRYGWDNGAGWFGGQMDEVRVSRVARSAGWLRTCWLNQGGSATFIEYDTSVGALPGISNAGGASNVTDVSAWLNGALISTGASPTEVWLYWGPTDGGDSVTNWAHELPLGLNTQPCPALYSVQITGLDAGTAYYYRYRAANAAGQAWASPSAALRTVRMPLVDNGAGATDVRSRSAKLRGNLTSDTTAEIRIYLGKTDGGTNTQAWSQVVSLGTLGMGAFSSSVTGLAANTKYYYRCYAENLAGVQWADSSASFTTAIAVSVALDRNPVPRYERLQMTVASGISYVNPFNPDEVDLRADFTAPSGNRVSVNGFWDGSQWRIRFAAAETGLYAYTVSLADALEVSQVTGTVAVVSSSKHGWVRTSPLDSHYLEHDDGTPFYGIGFCKPWQVSAGMFPVMKANGCNIFVYWLPTWDNYLLDLSNGYDRYNMTKAANVDQIIAAAEASDVLMILTVWYHGFLRDYTQDWGYEDWSKNPFKALSSAQNFFTDPTSWAYQQKFYRYLIARWGYSTSLGMWQTISEIDGTSARKADRDTWHSKIHNYFAGRDPFRHPTTGAKSEPSSWPGAFAVMDCVQVHNYTAPQDQVGIAANAGGWTGYYSDLFDKPNFHGEVGMPVSSGESARTAYQHNGTWAALVNGAAINPLMWNDGGDWGNQTAAMYQQMSNVWNFVRSFDIAAQSFIRANVTTTLSGGRVWGLKGTGMSMAWVQDTTPGEDVSGAAVTFNGLAPGDYCIRTYDTWNGVWSAPVTSRSAGGSLTVSLPIFQNDVAIGLMAYNALGRAGDTDADGIPDAWEIQLFGGLATCGAGTDNDRDVFTDAQESAAGTDPRDPASRLAVATVSEGQNGDYVISWQSASNRSYDLFMATDLSKGSFTSVVSGIPATPPLNLWTTATDQAGAAFYRVGMKR